MKRNPQEIMMLLAGALKKTKEGDSMSIKQIREKTGLHYETIQSYAEIIKYIQTSMPKINYEKESGITVLERPDLNISQLEELVLFLFDSRAFRESMSSEVPNWASEELLLEGNEKGFLVNRENSYYLTSQGILEGVDLADKRESALIDPIGRFVQEPEEGLVEKAFLSIPKTDSSKAYGFWGTFMTAMGRNPKALAIANADENRLSEERRPYLITKGTVEAS